MSKPTEEKTVKTETERLNCFNYFNYVECIKDNAFSSSQPPEVMVDEEGTMDIETPSSESILGNITTIIVTWMITKVIEYVKGLFTFADLPVSETIIGNAGKFYTELVKGFNEENTLEVVKRSLHILFEDLPLPNRNIIEEELEQALGDRLRGLFKEAQDAAVERHKKKARERNRIRNLEWRRNARN